MQQLYTPQAVRYIASASGSLTPEQIARYLGWDINQVERIAEKHKIKLLVPEPSTGQQERPPVIRRLDTAPNSPPTFQPRVTAEMTLDQIKAVLGPRQAEVFSALESTLRTRQPIRTCQIVSYCGMRCTSSNICQIIRRIDQHLAVTKWRIEFARFQRGGYRLVVRT